MTYSEGGEQYQGRVRAGRNDRASAVAIGQLTVPSSRAGRVPQSLELTRAATAALLAIVLLAPTVASAQPVQAAPAGQVITVTRDEAVRLALANNPDLAAARFEPEISDARVAEAQSAYVPTLQSGLQRSNALAPPTNLFAGSSGLRTGVWSATVAVNQLLRWGGGNYSVGFDSSRTTSDSLLSSLNPALAARIQLAFSQPLLRDFHIDPARAQIEIARRNREIADNGLRETQVTTTSGAERAYWSLVAAVAQVDVQQRALDLALELERTNRARVDVGQSPPLDLVAARAEVAQRREGLIVARTNAREAEDQLRTLIIDPKRDDYWMLRVEPTDKVPPVGAVPDVDAAVRVALAERTDIVRARRQIENSETTIQLARSDTLPDLRVQANYLTDSAGGTRLIRTGGFPGTVTGSESTSYANLLGQVFGFDYPTWTVGVTFSYPLGKSAAEANLARARIEKDQTAARLRSIELTAVREIREAALRVAQNRERIDTARLSSGLAEQRLDAEQRRFEVGMSTSFLVIQAQRDLAVARNNELQATLDYQLALIRFQTAQHIGGQSQF